MLVKEFDEDGNYTGKLAPLINKTTLDCKVRINLQVEIVFMFDYTYCALYWMQGIMAGLEAEKLYRSVTTAFLNIHSLLIHLV